MNARNYQPSLVWSLAHDWYINNLPEQPATEYRPHDLTVYVYRTDSTGAWMMTNPKLYWQETPITGDHFENCDQNELWVNNDLLGEVVIYDRKLRKSTVVGKTFDEAWEKISK
ncbi:MAG: hypothetical protein PHS34_08875 [Candidatus Omnitrophica bacterium]|nr:hypothetical protein [Candidatus Omnitrophota bacterium]